jgi:hypothetical protein
MYLMVRSLWSSTGVQSLYRFHFARALALFAIYSNCAAFSRENKDFQLASHSIPVNNEGMFGFWHRRRFRDVVRRQLAMFHEEEQQLVTEARRELRAYHDSRDPAEAQAHYARYDDLCEDAEDFLVEMRDSMAASMDADRSRHYRAEFDRQARSRYGDIISRLGFDDIFDEAPTEIGERD